MGEATAPRGVGVSHVWDKIYVFFFFDSTKAMREHSKR